MCGCKDTCTRIAQILVLWFHQYLWASISLDLMKITVSGRHKFKDHNPIRTACYLKLHFNELLILWIKNSTEKFSKTGIQ